MWALFRLFLAGVRLQHLPRQTARSAALPSQPDLLAGRLLHRLLRAADQGPQRRQRWGARRRGR